MQDPSLVPRPIEAEEVKMPGFSRSCMHMIISYLSMCKCGGGREMTFRCLMVSSLTSFVYSGLELRAVHICLQDSQCPRSMPAVCAGLIL